MKKYLLLFVASALLPMTVISVQAQIRINIPGLPKAKPTPTPTPAPAATPAPQVSVPTVRTPSTPQVSTVNEAKQASTPSGDSPKWMNPPKWGDQAEIIRETVDVSLDITETYWKAPDQYNFSSWYPNVKFQVAYQGSMLQRYQVEWFLPDGKPWFTDQIKVNSGNVYDTKRNDEKFKQASNMGGVYGFKITDTRSSKVLFEGKFKVSKYKVGNPIPMFKNSYGFAVDHDGELAAGFVGFKWKYDNFGPPLVVSTWLKGDLRGDSIEARLYYNGTEISTTDANGGSAMSEQYRLPYKDADKFPEGVYKLYEMQFPVRYLFRGDSDRSRYPGARFINDADGVYTVKVFIDGDQVRETSFNVKNGMVEGNGIAEANGYLGDRVVVPVKVMGTKEKIDAAAAKTGLFMNPIKGIQ